MSNMSKKASWVLDFPLPPTAYGLAGPQSQGVQMSELVVRERSWSEGKFDNACQTFLDAGWLVSALGE